MAEDRKRAKKKVKLNATQVAQVVATVIQNNRIKGRPRGRPLKGIESCPPEKRRMLPGVCLNPGGRPKFAKLSEAMRAELAMPLAKSNSKKLPSYIDTNAEAIAWRVAQMAKAGHLGAVTILGDRAEGRPVQAVALIEGKNNLAALIDSMNAVSDKLGPPEGMPKKKQPPKEE